MNNKERILFPCIHIDDGKEYSNSPENIKSGFIESGENHIAIKLKLFKRNIIVDNPQQEGFYTDKGRFVGRVEAGKIAYQANQLKVKYQSDYKLMSDDLIK